METISLDKSKIKFLLLEGIHPRAVEYLKKAGYNNIETEAKSLSDEELKERIKNVHFLGIRSRTQLGEEILQHAKKLVAIGCFCIGTNQVDLIAARRRGIPVFNAPYSNTRSVAELVVAEIIMLFRGIPEKNAKAHLGKWLKSASHSHEVRGKILGIIGYGAIGSQLSVLAESLGLRVIFYDIQAKLPLGNVHQVESLAKLLESSDVVSLHVPETPETKNLIGAAQIEQMKPGAYLINASRGTVVDIDALTAAIKSKKLQGAAIDVFPIEPHSNNEQFVSPLCEFDNVILTPHIGGSTMEAQENIGVEVIEKLVRYSDNGTTTSSVNFPEVALPEHPNKHRILHIHENIPGMMTKINSIFSALNVNIYAQYLQTLDNIGYVVMDIEPSLSKEIKEKLMEISGSVRVRVLF